MITIQTSGFQIVDRLYPADEYNIQQGILAKINVYNLKLIYMNKTESKHDIFDGH
jgi:hypothetical protein